MDTAVMIMNIYIQFSKLDMILVTNDPRHLLLLGISHTD